MIATKRLPVELKPESVVALVDTREQLPLDLAPLRCEVATLDTGDYSVKGLESIVAVERKSLPDLLGCVGRDRERFDREVQRLLAYPTRALVVEATWPEIEAGEWRSKITPAAALGSLLGWVAMGLPVLMAGDHERAGRYVSRLLFTAARRRWRESREFLGLVAQASVAESVCDTADAALRAELKKITPSNARLKELAAQSPPLKDWIEGPEEDLF